MPKDGVITEPEWQWLAALFKEDDDWRAEVRKRCGDNKYMRGVKPKKHKEVKTLFHKELIERIDQLTKRVDEFESRMDKLEGAAYFRYYDWRTWATLQEMPASKAIEKILDHLHLTFDCEPAKEKKCHLVSTLPVRKPKKKVKKKTKKKK